MSTTLAAPTSLDADIDAFLQARADRGVAGEVDRLLGAARRALAAEAAGAAAVSWPEGGGACGALVRTRDWGQTPLGPAASWPEALRTTLVNILHSPVPKVLMWGAERRLLYNDAYLEIAGARHPELSAPLQSVWPERAAFDLGVVDAVARDEIAVYRDHPLTVWRRGQPQELVFDLFHTPIRDNGQAIAGVMCTFLDASARADVRNALARSEDTLRSIVDVLPMMVGYVDRDLIYRFVNRHYEAAFDRPTARILGAHVRDVLGEAQYQQRLPLIARALAGEMIHCDAELAGADGTPRAVELHYIPRLDGGHGVEGFYIVVLDIEDRVRRERALAISSQRFAAAVSVLQGRLWTADAAGQVTAEATGWGELTGQTPVQFSGDGWADAIHPDDRPATVVAWQDAVREAKVYEIEHRVRRFDGVYRNFAARAVPVTGDDGAIVEWVGVHIDISHQRAAEASLQDQAETLARQVRQRERAEEELRDLNETLEARVIAEIDERRRAETLLAQAQKMESLGKLTGGVAHDFNNLLQVISGNLQLLGRDLTDPARAERRIALAMTAVERGAKLASQLLSFGRRQPLEPKVVNVSRFVLGMEDMLRRAIGDAIEIETVYGGGLWNTFIDPAQVENALLNLAINARDAMEGGGRLTIELSNAHLDDAYARAHDEVEPGHYVMLAVSDTGCGMSPEIMERVFEPFYSTKGEGKGSGLGLSMVYGFVRQSGGHVKIYSEVGHGTTIRLYLPRAQAPEDGEVSLEAGPVIGGAETVLVVEDDEAVRETVVGLLSGLGYGVLTAGNAQSALAVIESGVAIDVLLTDVVMPGTLKSPELARRAQARLPRLAVLFTSGYTENAIVHGGRLDAGLELLSKPYTRDALARKIRSVIASRDQRAQPASDAAALAGPRVPAPIAPIPSAASAARGVTVLLVEDDELIRTCTAEVLSDAGFTVVEASGAGEALSALDANAVDVLVTDINLRGVSGPDLAAHALARRPDLSVIFASGDVVGIQAQWPTARVLAKPYDAAALVALVSDVASQRA